MLKVYKPLIHASSIYNIDIEFFKKLGIKVVFMDLDNTLDGFKTPLPSDRAIKFIETLKVNNIKPIIISNNSGRRVKIYSEALGIEYLPNSGKPFGGRIRKYIQEKGFNKEEIVMIGDQTTTDVAAGNNAGLKTILTDPIVKEDQIRTKFNRIFDKFYRKQLAKNNELIDWREFYGKD